MQLNLTGTRVNVTPALKAFTHEKFNKLGEYFEKIRSIHVVFDMEKSFYIVNATIDLCHDDAMVAHVQAKDMYIAVDEVVHKLYNQLNKNKNKILDQRNHRNHLSQNFGDK